MIGAIDIRSAARLLGGDVVGRDSVLCPGPNHSAVDRSLSVKFSTNGAFTTHSYASDNWKECRDHVSTLLRLPPDLKPTSENVRKDSDTHSFAMELWRETKPLPGTPGAMHLEERGVSYEGVALRWHPSCPFGKDRVGCMVALVRNIITNKPQAIHRTAIDGQGKKLSHLGSNGRLSLGPVKNGAVKLTDNAEVERVIAVGEGIETALSIRKLPDLEQMPVWSLLSAQGIASFPALPGIESVWIAADHDASGTGQRAAATLARQLGPAGVEAIVIKPHAIGSDINDTIRGRCHA